ncbi:hypothetical protein Tco_0993688, partial [Tanacetum coccineum]
LTAASQGGERVDELVDGGRGMRKPKRGNINQVDVLILTIQKEIMVPVEDS